VGDVSQMSLEERRSFVELLKQARSEQLQNPTPGACG